VIAVFFACITGDYCKNYYQLSDLKLIRPPSMKKKILYIMHLPPPIHGAAMVGQYILDSSILKRTFESDYVNLSTSSSLADIGKGGINKVRSLLKVMKNVTSALLSEDYDLCYMTLTATGPGFYKDLAVVVLLKAFRKNIIYHFHNKGVAIASEKRFHNTLYRFTFKNTQSILLTKSLYSDIAKFVPERQIYYCANGIPEYKIERHLKIYNEDAEPCKLLFLSNMMQEKGVYILLAACKLLFDRGVNFQCDFVGAWSDVSEIDFKSKVIDLELMDCVFAHGKKYGTEKNTYLSDADVFVFPTYYHNECLPLVLLEAMQHSIPVVSTPEGGITDVVADGKTGFLVTQRNEVMLADKLEILINNPDMRMKMGAAAKQSYEKNYTLLQFEKRIEKIFKTLTPSLRDIKAAKNSHQVKLTLS
jgi:glycosyltransferase involved in cell wall biosynthesis